VGPPSAVWLALSRRWDRIAITTSICGSGPLPAEGAEGRPDAKRPHGAQRRFTGA
jgi:hypothetical protein